jgi:hypothetical protein
VVPARNHGNPAVPEQTLRFEQLSIAVEKTRGINLSGGKCQSCIPLTPDVVAVLASEHVEDSHGEITVGIQAVRA